MSDASTPLTDDQARVVASWFQDPGAGASLAALASTGYIGEATEACIKHEKTLFVPGTLHHKLLSDLQRYVQVHGQREAQPGWSKRWDTDFEVLHKGYYHLAHRSPRDGAIREIGDFRTRDDAAVWMLDHQGDGLQYAFTEGGYRLTDDDGFDVGKEFTGKDRMADVHRYRVQRIKTNPGTKMVKQNYHGDFVVHTQEKSGYWGKTSNYYSTDAEARQAVQAFTERGIAAEYVGARPIEDRVANFVHEGWAGLYRVQRGRRTDDGGEVWEATLHGPGGPKVFTKVNFDGSMQEYTRDGDPDRRKDAPIVNRHSAMANAIQVMEPEDRVMEPHEVAAELRRTAQAGHELANHIRGDAGGDVFAALLDEAADDIAGIPGKGPAQDVATAERPTGDALGFAGSAEEGPRGHVPSEGSTVSASTDVNMQETGGLGTALANAQKLQEIANNMVEKSQNFSDQLKSHRVEGDPITLLAQIVDNFSNGSRLAGQLYDALKKQELILEAMNANPGHGDEAFIKGE